VAAAAAMCKIPCAIIVPSNTPLFKIQNIESHGARVILCEPTQAGRVETSNAEAERMGAALIPPYNHADVIAGQGTIGLELAEQVALLDAIFVPVSGGGLLTGIALGAKLLRPDIRVFAVEPAGKRLGEAFARSTRVLDADFANQLLPTIADAIRTQALGPLPWDLALEYVEPQVLSVSDDQIRGAMRCTAEQLKQAVEPAGAVALAGILSPTFQELRAEADQAGQPLQNVAAIVCGGNVNVAELSGLIAGP